MSDNLQSSVAVEYLEGKEFFKFPRLKQARILVNENPLLWKNAEAARSTLRYIAGKGGKKDAKRGTGTRFMETEDRPKNPYKLPESDETKFETFILRGHKRVAVLSDIHIPYHSIHAVSAALDFCKKDKPDALL